MTEFSAKPTEGHETSLFSLLLSEELGGSLCEASFKTIEGRKVRAFLHPKYLRLALPKHQSLLPHHHESRPEVELRHEHTHHLSRLSKGLVYHFPLGLLSLSVGTVQAAASGDKKVPLSLPSLQLLLTAPSLGFSPSCSHPHSLLPSLLGSD